MAAELSEKVEEGRRKLTPAQRLLAIHLRELGFEDVRFEYRANPDRRWRWDLAIPSHRLLFECNGGQFHGGHRRSGAIDLEDEKHNWAVMAGWRPLQWSNLAILRGEAKQFLQEWLK